MPLYYQDLPRRQDHSQNNELPVFNHGPAQDDCNAEYYSADGQQFHSRTRKKSVKDIANIFCLCNYRCFLARDTDMTVNHCILIVCKNSVCSHRDEMITVLHCTS